MRRVSVVAVAAGVAVDLVATNLLLFPVMAGVAGTQAIQVLPPSAQGDAIVAAMSESPAVYALGVILGSLASIAGGWIAARMAGRFERLHGALSSIGCVGLGTYAWVADIGGVSAWVHLLFLVLSPTLGVMGGMWRARQKMSPRVADPTTGWQRALYWTDWSLSGIAAAALIMFCTLGVVSVGSEASRRSGATVAGLYMGVVAAAFVGAAIALRRRDSRHWGLRVAAIALSLLGIAATM